jgi:hypothetical protein
VLGADEDFEIVVPGMYMPAVLTGSIDIVFIGNEGVDDSSGMCEKG